MVKKDTPNRLLEVSNNNTIPKPLCLSQQSHQLHPFECPQTVVFLLFFYTVSDFLQCPTALK